MTEKLLPCPFCNDAGRYYNDKCTPYHDEIVRWWAECGNSECVIYGIAGHNDYASREEARAAWNARSLPAALDVVIAEVERRIADLEAQTNLGPLAADRLALWNTVQSILPDLVSDQRALRTEAGEEG